MWGGGVEVRKVKAHTDEEDVELGIISVRDRFGNFHADAEAKRGAKLAESLSPVGVARAELVKGLRWVGWARRFAAGWSADVEEEEERAGRAAAWEKEGRPGRVAAGLRHLVWERGLEWKCRRCGREANTEQRRAALRSSRCLGSAVGRLLAKTCADAEAVARCCVERKADMESRGWRPKGGAEGGECSTAGVQYLFGEEEDELGDCSGREEEEAEGVGGPWAAGGGGGTWNWERARGRGGAAAAPAAAASAGGSGSATAGAAEAAAQRARPPAVVPLGGPPEGHSQPPAPHQEDADLTDEGAQGVEPSVADARRKRPRTDKQASAGQSARGMTGMPARRGMKRGPDRDRPDQDGDDEPRRRAREGPHHHLHLHQRGEKRRLRQEGGRQVEGEGRHVGHAGVPALQGDDEDAPSGPSEPGVHAAGGLVQEDGPQDEGKRRRQSVADGDRGTARAYGRRYTGVVSDPVDTDGTEGHALYITGPIIWCDKCGRYATRRVRKSLKEKCLGLATGAYPTRLARLRAGRHPMTGEPIVS